MVIFNSHVKLPEGICSSRLPTPLRIVWFARLVSTKHGLQQLQNEKNMMVI